MIPSGQLKTKQFGAAGQMNIEPRLVTGSGCTAQTDRLPLTIISLIIRITRAELFPCLNWLSNWTSNAGWFWFPSGSIPPLDDRDYNHPLLTILSVWWEVRQHRAFSHSNKHLLISSWLIQRDRAWVEAFWLQFLLFDSAWMSLSRSQTNLRPHALFL